MPKRRRARFGKAEEGSCHGVGESSAGCTISDLILDNEDMSLVTDALRDALHASQAFDLEKLAVFLCERQPKNAAHSLYEELITNAGIDGGGHDGSDI